MERPFFSVVMPAYGVEKYLKKAVDSIRNQTFEDWELIIVEDGSPDRTGELADRLAGKDLRIRAVHHEKNKGLSQARNTGIHHAKGKYIWFMDPDDSVEESLLQDVWKAQQENPAKLTVFGHMEEYYEKDGSFSYAHPVKPHERFCRTRNRSGRRSFPWSRKRYMATPGTRSMIWIISGRRSWNMKRSGSLRTLYLIFSTVWILTL